MRSDRDRLQDAVEAIDRCLSRAADGRAEEVWSTVEKDLPPLRAQLFGAATSLDDPFRRRTGPESR